ncbi:MAG: hypothetical protein QOJ15_3304 [Bradyrhizobium sp.]|jgi:uncharacterized protein YjiS (DUF1127 family)|nr:hypothetical protein [Bradyrhizobium sp.]
MSEMHSSGSVKRIVRLQSIPSEARFAPREKNGLAHQQTSRPGLARAKSLPRVVPATTQADRIPIDIWSWMIASFIEGFALYGASFHGIPALPVDPHSAKTGATPPEKNSFHGRHISLVSSSADPVGKTPELGRSLDSLTPELGEPSATDRSAGRDGLDALEFGQLNRWHWPTSCRGSVVTLWRHWRRERKIKKSVAALADFDDQTLFDMGIPRRSQIEQVVRYCHDC